MARTTIEGGCKWATASSPVDTLGYGKVTIIGTGNSLAVSATGGETSDLGTDISDKIVDPTTGKAAGTLGSAKVVLGYTGSMRFIQVAEPSDAIVLLSEPRSTN